MFAWNRGRMRVKAMNQGEGLCEVARRRRFTAAFKKRARARSRRCGGDRTGAGKIAAPTRGPSEPALDLSEQTLQNHTVATKAQKR